MMNTILEEDRKTLDDIAGKAGAEIIWEKQVSQTQISYPGTPVFRPGIPYSVTIQTDGGQSSEQDKASKIEFIRLHSSEVATIQAEVNELYELCKDANHRYIA